MNNLTEQQMNVFIAALIRTRDIEQAYAATESYEPEDRYIILDAAEASKVSNVLDIAERSAERDAEKNPNAGNKEDLSFIKSVRLMFGSKVYVGGYASDEARSSARMDRFADYCEKYGCD